ncbi:MAG: hypothetical protein N3D73_03215 [Candidatus Diapherotrites archaeon]|nr:hypothetical protein [Candidatus Diapherotrites archaeon]
MPKKLQLNDSSVDEIINRIKSIIKDVEVGVFKRYKINNNINKIHINKIDINKVE